MGRVPNMSDKALLLTIDIKWKNERAQKGEAYKPTNIEHVANIASHGICILPSIYATYVLQDRASCPIQNMASLIYGGALFLLFTISTVFHSVCFCHCHKYKDTLHRCDRAMIYLFIAASYFPFLILYHHHGETHGRPDLIFFLSMENYSWAVWILASLGILYQQVFHERYKWLETLFYVIMGLVPSLPFWRPGREYYGLEEAKIGGLFYLFGIFFFKSDGKIPCAHAIWHLFVALGATTHYYTMFNYLIGPSVVTEIPIGCISALSEYPRI